jgi:hypothetical protein
MASGAPVVLAEEERGRARGTAFEVEQPPRVRGDLLNGPAAAGKQESRKLEDAFVEEDKVGAARCPQSAVAAPPAGWSVHC